MEFNLVLKTEGVLIITVSCFIKDIIKLHHKYLDITQ